MQAVVLSRTTVLIVAGVLTATAVGFSIAALMTPAWQTVVIWEFKTEHQHGLWIDCTRKLDVATANGRIGHSHAHDNPWSCSYKFDHAAEHLHGEHATDGHMHANGSEHKFLGWHLAVITLILLSVFAGFVALCSICCSPFVFACSLVTNFALLFTVLVSFAAVIVAFINSHKPDSRFLNAGSTTYEQHRGYSYWFEVTSALLFLVAFALSVLGSGLSIFASRYRVNGDTTRTYPKHNTSV